MAESIKLPVGAFAAMRAGKPQPAEPQPAPKLVKDPAPKVEPKPEVKEPKLEAKPDPASKAAIERPPTETEKKIWKLKADGEEFEFDASDEEAVKQEIMRARGANKRFESAAAMRKQAEQFFDLMKTPDGIERVAKHLGLDLEKFAEDKVWAKIQAQQREAEWTKNPELKTQWEDRQELERLRREKAERDAVVAEGTKKASVARFESEYETKITQALKQGGIPNTPGAVQRMAEYLERAVEQGLDLTPDELVLQVRKDYLSDFGAVLGAADEDAILAILGEEVAAKLRKGDLKRLKSTESNPFPKQIRSKQNSAKSDKPKRMVATDWKEDVMRGFLERK